MSRPRCATPLKHLSIEYRIQSHVQRHNKIYFTVLILLGYGLVGYVENM